MAKLKNVMCRSVLKQPDGGSEEAYDSYRQPNPVGLRFLVAPSGITGGVCLVACAEEVEAKVPKAKSAALPASQHGKPNHA
jgi:hypothetical protein